MRNIIFLIHVSLDGFVAGPNGEMDWITYNEEVANYSYSLHGSTDAALYGRNTYQMMAAYWSTVLDDPNSDPSEHPHAHWTQHATKYVVSTTLQTTTWAKSVIISGDLTTEINKIKQQPGKDIWLLGSPTLAQSLMQLDLIDEYRINVNPVLLGAGQPLFGHLEKPHNLTLEEAKVFKDGVVGLRYTPKR